MSLTSAKKLLLSGGRFERSGAWLYSLNGWVNKANPIFYQADGLRLIDNSFLQYDVPPSKFQNKQIRLEFDARVVLASNNGFIDFQYIIDKSDTDTGGIQFGRVSLTEPSQENFARYGFTTPKLSGTRIRVQINHSGSDTRVRNWAVKRI